MTPFSTPPHISLKSLTLDARGNLARRRMVGPLSFAFSHHQRRYDCRFYERSDRSGLVVSHSLGIIPTGKHLRAQARTVLRQARERNIGLVLRRTGMIELEQRCSPQPPVSGFTLVAHLTQEVLRCEPWLALIEDLLATEQAQASA